MPPTAFVAGATGYTGQAVVARCVSLGWKTVAHIRPQSSGLVHWRDHFTRLGASVDTTAWEPAALAATLAAVAPSCVFALLGTTRRRARAEGLRDPYLAVDLRLTTMLIDACTQLPTPPRLVYLSSQGVRWHPVSRYLEARHRAEAHLVGSGLPYCIARPSLISGPNRQEARKLERLAARFADGAGRLLATVGSRRMADRLAPVTNEQLAVALLACATAPQLGHRVVEAGELRALIGAPAGR